MRPRDLHPGHALAAHLIGLVGGAAVIVGLAAPAALLFRLLYGS
jgi:hypothetical protein